MAEIEWKGIVWKAAYGSHSIKELLTILKGYGPMEIIRFEKPGEFCGELSLSLNADGTKEITVYHLEVLGRRRQGGGRRALQELKKIFRGEVYVEDPGVIKVRNADSESLPFWIRMYEEGLIDALDSVSLKLHPHMSAEELAQARSKMMEQTATDPKTVNPRDDKEENQVSR